MFIVHSAAGVTTEFWSEPGVQPYNPENEPFLAWLQQADAMPDNTIPKVFSVSYGDDEDSVNQDYANRVNVEFQKLGARGISIMFSSCVACLCYTVGIAVALTESVCGCVSPAVMGVSAARKLVLAACLFQRSLHRLLGSLQWVAPPLTTK
jgi:hypothetical protein